MCALCALHRVSQGLPTMLPWLVVPLLALWGASQLLPPPLRFEVTPACLACGLFLVAVLLWYHVFMPQLLTWQARRSARLQERRRFLAVELQRLRRTAIRRCRNCLTEYRDQNPPAGRFMCCYCGHISKRPVFDLPGSSGIIHELIGNNSWMCPREWSDVGSAGGWVGSIPHSEKWCARKLVSFAARWIYGKFPIVGGEVGDGSGADRKGPGKEEEEGRGVDCMESKCDKARRKAEERRQARLEKEMQEEEDRKQREEVYLLVEEQRKLKDDKLEAVREALRSSALDGGRDGRKDSGKKGNARRKEKDWGSSKSNSDVEELEKRVNRECEKKIECEQQEGKKAVVENSRKIQCAEALQGVRGMASKSRYLDRLRGSFFQYGNGTNGKGAQNAAGPSSKPSKTIGWPAGSSRRGGYLHTSGQVLGQQLPVSGNGKDLPVANQHPVVDDQPQHNVWKNGTHWLFKKSLSISPSQNQTSTPIAPPNGQMAQISNQLDNSSKNNAQVVQTLPFSLHPYIDCPIGSDLASLVCQKAAESVSSVEETFHSSRSEEGDLFEDPCYNPDPVELLGALSDSLDNFPVDVGGGFVAHTNLNISGPRTNASVFNGTSMGGSSSLGLPMSSLDLPGIDPITSINLPDSLMVEDPLLPRIEGDIKSEPGIWHMWGSSPKRNSLGVIGGSSSWLLPIKEDESELKAANHPFCNHTLPMTTEGQPLLGTDSPPIDSAAMSENGGSFAMLDGCLTDYVPWIQKTVFQPLCNDSVNVIPPLKLQGSADGNEEFYGSPNKFPSGLPFDLSCSKGLEALGIREEIN